MEGCRGKLELAGFRLGPVRYTGKGLKDLVVVRVVVGRGRVGSGAVAVVAAVVDLQLKGVEKQRRLRLRFRLDRYRDHSQMNECSFD